jgi:hypothetical protein|tara:strand:+ start:725 stop:1051 length:327 start_codon:yes stop_codon:yes gene_type:complete
VRRSDVLNANREQWDAWEKSTSALRKVRTRLLQIVEDPESSPRDAIAAGKLIEERGLGRPTEEREQLPQQTLIIVRPGETGGFINAGPVVEGELVQRAITEPEETDAN